MTPYSKTLVAKSPWKKLSPTFRKNFIMGFWVVTFAALVLGYANDRYWNLAIAITALQSLIVLALVKFRPLVFPAQLRIAYVAWLALGTHIPELYIMMPITTIGLGANLAFGYCPLARLMTLLPWNRDQPLSWHFVAQAALKAPAAGRFSVERRLEGAETGPRVSVAA